MALMIQLLIVLMLKGKTDIGIDIVHNKSSDKRHLVLLGSSRCRVHLDPAFFDSLFNLETSNLGVNGHTEISMTTIQLRRYVEKNRPPEYVVVSIDPLMSAGSVSDNTNYIDKDKFARLAFFACRDPLITGYFKFNPAEKYIPLYALFKYGTFWDCIKSCCFKESESSRYENHREHWDTMVRPFSDTIRKYFFRPKDIPAIRSALSQLKELCAEYNSKLLCVQTPIYRISKEDSLFLSPAIICRSLNIPFEDADQKFLSSDIDNFFNIDHLNSDGVKKMNGYLRNDTNFTSFFKQEIK
jgi:hypothetical protein